MGSPQQAHPEGDAGRSDRKLVPVQLATLQTHRCYAFDLYLHKDDEYTLYRARQTKFTRADRDRLLANDVRFLHIDVGDHPAYRSYLVDELETLVSDPNLSVEQRAQGARQGQVAVAQGLLTRPDRKDVYQDADRLVRSVVELVICEPDSIQGMVKMLRHDYYTFTHLINVSTLSLLLALKLGIKDRDQLCRLGVGGLLHDIGKTRVGPAILNCPNPLTDQQMAELRRHADYGMMMVMYQPGVCREVLQMVHQHHERLDGSGYPVGLLGDEIAFAGRICAVVDVYDAMTSERPYRGALDRQFALDHIQSLSGERLDPRIAAAWLEVAPDKQANETGVMADARMLAEGALIGAHADEPEGEGWTT
jgi:HD-GYP domain-containing protein (c-di-GMP phosphodiesterase class II)